MEAQRDGRYLFYSTKRSHMALPMSSSPFDSRVPRSGVSRGVECPTLATVGILYLIPSLPVIICIDCPAIAHV